MQQIISAEMPTIREYANMAATLGPNLSALVSNYVVADRPVEFYYGEYVALQQIHHIARASDNDITEPVAVMIYAICKKIVEIVDGAAAAT